MEANPLRRGLLGDRGARGVRGRDLGRRAIHAPQARARPLQPRGEPRAPGGFAVVGGAALRRRTRFRAETHDAVKSFPGGSRSTPSGTNFERGHRLRARGPGDQATYDSCARTEALESERGIGETGSSTRRASRGVPGPSWRGSAASGLVTPGTDGRARRPLSRASSSRSPSATTSSPRAELNAVLLRRLDERRSSASITTSARRRCRTCSSSGSPTRSSSRSGTGSTSTTRRSRGGGHRRRGARKFYGADGRHEGRRREPPHAAARLVAMEPPISLRGGRRARREGEGAAPAP